MVEALRHAGASVRARLASSPPLGVGDLSRARGGPIAPYSRSHQSGRDSDLAFYRLDAQGAPVVADDLIRFDAQGQTRDRAQTFDAERNWLLVRALLEDRTIEVEWMFISEPLRKTLLAEAAREGAPAELAQRAARLLHQPSDAPPHDDHLHLRLRCTAAESRAGCMG